MSGLLGPLPAAAAPAPLTESGYEPEDCVLRPNGRYWRRVRRAGQGRQRVTVTVQAHRNQVYVCFTHQLGLGLERALAAHPEWDSIPRETLRMTRVWARKSPGNQVADGTYALEECEGDRLGSFPAVRVERIVERAEEAS